MREKNKEPELTYALDSSGKMVHIGNVERGLSCNCRCPKCNELLVAKLGHEGGRQAHFAHHKGSDCHGSYMSALHKLAEQIIEKEMAVMAPAYKEIDKQKLEFESVEVEQRVERKDLQPDIVGVTSDGLRWFIEIRNTHEVDEAKRGKLIESNITCLEIDVREQTLENLKSFLLESTKSREWINNPNYEKQIEDLNRNKVSRVVKYFVENPELKIPNAENISLKNLSIFVSEDGLYARIEAVSSKEIPYLFHIGSHKVLKQIKPTKKCNELIIDTDKNHFNNGYASLLYMERIYFYIPEKVKDEATKDNKHNPECEAIPNTLLPSKTKLSHPNSLEKEQESIINEYKSNPRYEVKPKSDCYTKCIYSPFYDKCIYSKTIISYHGVDYVVCDKWKRQKDEAGASLGNMISDSRLSSKTRFQRFDNGLQEIYLKEQYYTKDSPIKPKQTEAGVPPKITPSQDSLPFDRFWTTEEFYAQLQSTSSYETEKGLLAEIVKYDRTNCGILLLYRDPSEVRTYCPFHIAIIYVNNGFLIRNKVADFISKSVALDSYHKRLRAMRENVYM